MPTASAVNTRPRWMREPYVSATGAKPAQLRTGCGPYFGSRGSVHIRNVEPLPLVTTRRNLHA